jgi:NADPH:quinone reductase-like Zn-dependent oxidoreductase
MASAGPRSVFVARTSPVLSRRPGKTSRSSRRVTLISTERRQDLLTLKELIEAGKLAPVIDRTYPLREAAQAISYLEQGHARGKVVLTVSI